MEMQDNICTEIFKICTINCVKRVETILHMNKYLIWRMPFFKKSLRHSFGQECNYSSVPANVAC